jgi:hypothetical protein
LNCRFVTGVRSIQKHRHAMNRRFLGVMIVGAHAERAAGNPDHVAGPAIVRWPVVPLDVGPQQRHGAHSMFCTSRRHCVARLCQVSASSLIVSSKPNSSAGISPVNSKLTAKSKRNLDRGDLQVRGLGEQLN